MKTFSISRALLIGCQLAVSLKAGEEIKCKSPDGKFALRENYGHVQPYRGDAAIIDLRTHKPVVELVAANDDTFTLNSGPPQLKLLWSEDSKRVACFKEDAQGGSTRVFCRSGSSLNEIKLPELPSPQLPSGAQTGASDADTKKRVAPIQWLKSGELLLENELQNHAWGRAAVEITLGFDQDNQSSIRKSEQEKMSIVDYFLLLPDDYFERPPSTWLHAMRYYNYAIDKPNGYMSCAGDGAQPEFEVALFRHTDGRPLLAVCSGELEGKDSVYLQFFEMGDDGKMKEVPRSIFPVADSGYDPDASEGKGEWQFELPRTGKTILVRKQKGGRILHKLIWNGEKFQEEK